MQHWRGQYSYDEYVQELLPGELKNVHFEFTFCVRLFGLLAGEICDGEGGIPERAVAYGWIVPDKSIWFRKTYPRTWAPAPVTGEPYVFDTKKHVVDYVGTFDGPATISGAWKIRAHRRVINGFAYALPRVTGTWVASRV